MSSVSTSNLPAVVSAMDRLNSYARTADCASCHNLLRHIYFMKNEVIGMATKAGAATSRCIYVVVKCGKCGGSGVWNARTESSCWDCAGHGSVRLHFRETTIGVTLMCQDWTMPDIRWHSPITERQAGPEPERADGWTPRTPGKMLTTDELAAALNIVEPQTTPTLQRATYIMPLSGATESCCFCGVSAEQVNIMVVRGRLRWVEHVCDSCRGHYAVLAKEYKQDLLRSRIPLPKLSDEVMRWVERHGGLDGVLATMTDDEW